MGKKYTDDNDTAEISTIVLLFDPTSDVIVSSQKRAVCLQLTKCIDAQLAVLSHTLYNTALTSGGDNRTVPDAVAVSTMQINCFATYTMPSTANVIARL